MSDDAMSAIAEEISDHWRELAHADHLPAMVKESHVHRLANGEYNDLTDRERGLYNAGVLRGLELAADVVEDAEDDGGE